MIPLSLFDYDKMRVNHSVKIIPPLQRQNLLLQFGNGPLPFCDLAPDHFLGRLILVLLLLLRSLLYAFFLDL